MPHILQWNCRGLRTSISDLQVVIHQRRPVMICLQETKLSPESPCTIKGYSVLRKDQRAGLVAHGGVLLAVHHDIPVQELTLRTSLQAVAARIVLLQRPITICSLYLPPGEALPRSEVSQLLGELPEPLLLLGDFNAHHSLWGSDHIDSRGRTMERLICDEHLAVLNTGSPTHFTMPTGNTSAIDLSLVSPQVLPLFTWKVDEDPLGSDHFPVWLSFDSDANPRDRPRRWNMRNVVWSEFTADAESSFPTQDGQQHSVDTFTETLLDVAGRHIPMTSGSPRHVPVPWFNNECRDAIRARRRAFRAFNRNCSVDNMIAFKKARAVARRTKQEAKRKSWREYIGKLNCFTPVSQVWSQIKTISGRYSSSPPPVLRVRGQDVLHPADVAEEIGRAFAERSGNDSLDPAFSRHKRRCEASPVDFSTDELLTYNQSFSLAELKSAICKLRTVSEGPDRIHNDMLKHLPDNVLVMLLDIFNRLWENGEFPGSWREAIVIPILKPGKTGSEPLHYRPISLTSCLCKLMERLVNVRLSWFLESRNILTNDQCGFRRNRCTTDHLVTLDTVVRTAFKQRHHVGAVFFDVEGAYDFTWRHGILMKAYEHGIRGAMGFFIQNFLRDRFFRIRIRNHLSERFIQENGVPQGGVLSVALFALMINDIVAVLPQSIGRSLFVDDFAIWCTSSSRPAIERRLQMAITKLERWGSHNGLRFSTHKTKAMHFCRRRMCCPGVPLRLYGVNIPVDRYVRFLGLTLDDRLTYKEHFRLLREKCLKALNILKCVSRTTYGSDRRTLLLLYRSLIRSKLDYACVAYDSACMTAKRTLDVVHNSAIRIVTGAFRTSPVTSILAEAHELPLALRRDMLSMRYACKLRQFPEHPTYSHVFARRSLAVFQHGRQPRAVPFCVRVKRLLREAEINVRRIRPVLASQFPPWELRCPEIDTSLTRVNIKQLTETEARSLALERMGSYANYQHVYTDGSKTETGVGSAFVMDHVTRSFTLPQRATVYTSELIAIIKALSFIEVCDGDEYVIFTDSLSSLLALKDFNTQHPLLQDILVKATSLAQRGRNVVFCWIPSHVGIRGNDQADEAAKRATRAPVTRALPLPAPDLYPQCLSYTLQRWQTDWNEMRPSKLKAIKPRLAYWASSSRRSRKEEVTLSRLRIGHTHATHMYLVLNEDQPRCPRCREVLTVSHVLVTCTQLAEERRRFFGTDPRSLIELLVDDSPYLSEVLSFLEKIRFGTIYSPHS